MNLAEPISSPITINIIMVMNYNRLDSDDPKNALAFRRSGCSFLSRCDATSVCLRIFLEHIATPHTPIRQQSVSLKKAPCIQ